MNKALARLGASTTGLGLALPSRRAVRPAWAWPLLVLVTLALVPVVAHAQVVSGGTNPTTIVDNVASFILGPFGEGVAVLAVAGVGFMCWTGRMGFHSIGWLVAGLVLVFGSSFLVTQFIGGA